MSIYSGVGVAENVSNNLAQQEIARRVGWVQKDMAILSNNEKSRAVQVLHQVRDPKSKTSLLALEKFIGNPLLKNQNTDAQEDALKDKMAACCLTQCFYEPPTRVNLVALQKLRIKIGDDAFFQQLNKCKIELPDREIIDFFTSMPGKPKVLLDFGSSKDRVFESIQDSDL